MSLTRTSFLLFTLSSLAFFQLAPTIASASAAFDAQDKANLKIYTGQGYYINNFLRSEIPLSAVATLLDPKATPTCTSLIKANALYLSQIRILPFQKMKPTDSKLYSLVQDALTSRGQATPSKVFRGAHSCDFLIDSHGQPLKYFLEKAFLSTSTSEEVAQKFTVSMNMMAEKENPVGCLMKIEGLSGVPIAQATGNYNGEEEVLFPAGALFEVRDFHMNGEQKVFTLKEIDKSSPSYSSIKSALVAQETQTQITEIYPEFAKVGLKAGASQQLNVDAENACHEAYLFFTPNPEVRKSLAAKKPEYDLSNKKLKASDYVVEE